jgi:FixJ family two-component response regulator
MLDAVQLALEKDRGRLKSEMGTAELKSRFESLTVREREIMGWVAAGLMNKQIAAEMGLSEITVKVHRGNMMRKMGATSLAELVRMAEAMGVRRTL